MGTKDLYNSGSVIYPNIGVDISDIETSVESTDLSLSGYIGANGSYSAYNAFRSTDYISLNGYGSIKVSSVQGGSFVAWAIYDSNKTKIATSAYGSAGTTINDNIAIESNYAYVRFCKSATNSTYSAALVKDGVVSNVNRLSSKLSAMTIPRLNGKKVAFIGDSFTAGVGASNTTRYSSVFCAKQRCTEVNLGVAGDTIVGSTGFISRATASNLSDVDMVIVLGGTNDFSYDSKAIGDYFILEDNAKGTKTKTAQTDTAMFSGGLHALIKQIRSANSTAQILFMTIMNRGVYTGTSEATYNYTSAQCNSHGDYLQDFNKCIKEICSFYSIPVFDLNSAFGQDWSNDNGVTGILSSMDSDGIHPNVLGHKRIAELLSNYVENNIIL